MSERRMDIPPFASVVKQKMKELFDHHLLIYEGCKSEARDLEESNKKLKQLNDSLQTEVRMLKERNEILHSENVRLKEDLVNTSTRLSLPCENCRALMHQLEQQNRLLCTMMERKDQNLGEIIEKYLTKKSEESASKPEKHKELALCRKTVIDTLSQALSVSQDSFEGDTKSFVVESDPTPRSKRREMSLKEITAKNTEVGEVQRRDDKHKVLDRNSTTQVTNRLAETVCDAENKPIDDKVQRDDKVSPETSRRTGKLTQAGKRRRTRYTEETTPENKKKKYSPSAAATCKSSTELVKEQKQSSKAEVSSPPSHKVLAPDTCDVSMVKSPPILSSKPLLAVPPPEEGPTRKSDQGKGEQNSMEGEATEKYRGRREMGDNRRNKGASDNRDISNSKNKKDLKSVPHRSGFTVPDSLAMDVAASINDYELVNNKSAMKDEENRQINGNNPPDSVVRKVKGYLRKGARTPDNKKHRGKSLAQHDPMKSLLISPPSLSSTPISAACGFSQGDFDGSILESLPTFVAIEPRRDESYINDDDDSNEGNIIHASPCIVKKKSTKSFKHSVSSACNSEHSKSPPNSPVFGRVETRDVMKLKSSLRKNVGSPTLFEESPHRGEKSQDFSDEDSSLLLGKPCSEECAADRDESLHENTLNRSKRYRSPLNFTLKMGGEVKNNSLRQSLGKTIVTCERTRLESNESLTSPSVISGKLMELASDGKTSVLLRKSKSTGAMESDQQGKGKNRQNQQGTSQSRSRSKVYGSKSGRSPIGKLVIEKSTGGSKNPKKLFQTKINMESFHGKKSSSGEMESRVKEFNGKMRSRLSLTQQEEALIEQAKQASLSVDSENSERMSANNVCSLTTKGEPWLTSTPATSRNQISGMKSKSEETRLDDSPIPLDTQADARTVNTLHFHDDYSSNLRKDDNSEFIFKMPMLPVTPKRGKSAQDRNENLRRSPRLKDKVGDNGETDDRENRRSFRKLQMTGKSGEEESATKALSLNDLNGTLDPQFSLSEFDSVADVQTGMQQKVEKQLLSKKTLYKNSNGVNPDNGSKLEVETSRSGSSRRRITRSTAEVDGEKRQESGCDVRERRVDLDVDTGPGNGSLNQGLEECEDEYSEQSAVFGPVSVRPTHSKQTRAVEADVDDASEMEHHVTEEGQLTGKQDKEKMDSSFDRLPGAADQVDYKYVEVVRKKADRDKLDAYVCIECDRYFNGMDLPDEERQKRMRAVCRHKAKFAPPDTPEHYWSVGFPDTQECKERGYLNITQAKPSKFRRRKPLKQLSKAEIESKAAPLEPTSDISD